MKGLDGLANYQVGVCVCVCVLGGGGGLLTTDLAVSGRINSGFVFIFCFR